METKFSQGRWFIQEEMEAEILCKRFPAGIDNIATVHNQFDDDASKANAKLIAAAPEMFEALSAMIRIKDIYMPSDINEVRPEHYDEMTVLFKAFGQMEEVIKKATE